MELCFCIAIITDILPHNQEHNINYQKIFRTVIFTAILRKRKLRYCIKIKDML